MTDRYYGGLLFFIGTCMKLTEADYYAKDGVLYNKDGVAFSTIKKLTLPDNKVPESLFADFSAKELVLIEFPVSFACVDAENFDEAFLADLRSALKQLEQSGKTVIFSATGSVAGAEQSDVFYHIARRIKDCTSVAGLYFPAGITKEAAVTIITALQKKHPEYVYFTAEKELYDSLNKDYTGRIAFANV